MAVRTFKIVIDGDSRNARRAADQAERRYSKLESNLTRNSNRIAGTFRDTGTRIAKGLAVGAVGGLIALGGAFSYAFKEASEARKIGRQTENVIKTMGASSWTSSGRVERLARRLSELSGVDDELIQSGANLVLTFGNIRNAAGKGNAIFDRTVTLANDMSVALGQDMQKSSIQLGKALQDPIKGVTALRRVGVSFTSAQLDQIKVLQESGNLLGAQKLILKEVEKQFGGTAAAVADPWDRLKVTFGNIIEEIGGRFLPVADRAATWLSDNLPRALDEATRWFNTGRDAVAAFMDGLRGGDAGEGGGLVGFFGRLGAQVQPVVTWLGRAADAVGQFAQATRDFFQENPAVAWTVLGTVLGGIVLAGLVGVTAALFALIGPVTVVTAVVAALAGGFVYAYTNIEGFRDVVDTVVSWVKTTAIPALTELWHNVVAGATAIWQVAGPLIAQFAGYVREQVGNLVTWWKEIWPQVQEAVGHVWQAIRVIVAIALGWIMVLWNVFGEDIKRAVGAVWEHIRANIESVITIISGIIKFVLAVINGDWGKAWEAIKQVAGAAWDWMFSKVTFSLEMLKIVISAGWAWIQSVTTWVWGVITSVFFTAWESIKSAASNAVHWIGERLSGAWTSISERFKSVWGGVRDWFGTLWEGIKSKVTSGINAVLGVINFFIRQYDKVRSKVNSVPGVPNLPKINELGLIGGGGGGSNGGFKENSAARGGRGAAFHAAGGINPSKSGPFVTDGVRAIVGEGRSQYPEYVIPTDPQYRGRARGFLASAAEKIGYAAGGTLPRGPGIAGLYDPLAGIVARIVNESRGAVNVISGWRDSRKQAALYAAYKAGRGNLAAPPGSSKHERGAAVDFGGNSSVYQNLAAKYGLIFPVRGEKWHAEHPGQSGRGGLLGRAMQIIQSNVAGQLAPHVWAARSQLSRMSGGRGEEFTGMGHILLGGAYRMAQIYDEKANAVAAMQSVAMAPGMAGAGAGGGGSERWRSVALQALSMAGAPASWIGSLLRRMQQESGGNPNAINNWDSNARKGQASRGLMQTIPSTFNAYAGHLAGRGIFDPLANIYAAIRYTIARYGSGPAGWDRRGGYAAGGLLPRAFHNGGILPEDIQGIGPSGRRYSLQSGERVVRRGTGGSGGGAIISVTVVVKSDGHDPRRDGREAARGFDDELRTRGILTNAKIG